MKLTETTRLRAEDFPKKEREWVRPLIESYNSFLAQCIKLFNSGLIFADNIVGLEHDFDFTFQSQALTFPQSIKWPYDRFSPRNLFVTYSSEEGSPIPVVISWRFTDTRLVQLSAVYKFTSVPAISNLTAGSDYKIRVRIEP